MFDFSLSLELDQYFRQLKWDAILSNRIINEYDITKYWFFYSSKEKSYH